MNGGFATVANPNTAPCAASVAVSAIGHQVATAESLHNPWRWRPPRLRNCCGSTGELFWRQAIGHIVAQVATATRISLGGGGRLTRQLLRLALGDILAASDRGVAQVATAMNLIHNPWPVAAASPTPALLRLVQGAILAA